MIESGYCIVEAESLLRLQKEVNLCIGDGWKPSGPMQIEETTASMPRGGRCKRRKYIQALTRGFE